MATPAHPHQFAIGQQVLIKPLHDPLPGWAPGTVIAVSHTASTYHKDPYGESQKKWTRESDNHDEAICEGYIYDLLDPGKGPRLPRKACSCTYRMRDADPTGRWVGQRITNADDLALALIDAHRRGEQVTLDTDQGDSIQLVAAPGGHALASVRPRDLVAWASGVSPEQWSAVPDEETDPE